ncbi:MAG: hypothetical protein AB7N54_19360 [Alphaproteobacteria bacterium]
MMGSMADSGWMMLAGGLVGLLVVALLVLGCAALVKYLFLSDGARRDD